MKRVAWNFEISKDFNTLSEENQMSTTGGKFSFWGFTTRLDRCSRMVA